MISDRVGGRKYLSLLWRIDDVCLQFEAECRAGRQPELEPVLAAFADEERGELLAEILLLEWTYRHRGSSVFSLEEYRRRFPSWQTVVETAWQHWQEHQPLSETFVPAWRSTVWPQSASEPGTAPVPVLPGHEQVTRLGQGGMGEVFKAFDPRLKRWVALKTLRLDRKGAEPGARFRLEAEALARLTHPHIVKVHGFTERAGQPMLEMEYVAGGTLEKRLGRTPLDPDEAARLVAILAWAVHAAHEKGIVHRDLKPANVLMDDPVPGNLGNVLGGFPKISDFGLAALTDASSSQTLSGVILGTPAYMSPEQATGKPGEVGPSTDVWALGVILYRCLTGVLPFAGDSVLDTLERVRSGQMRPLQEVRPNLPLELVEVCMACLTRAPGDRPTAAALALRLERLADRGKRGTESARQARRGRREKLALGLVSAGLLAFGVWSLSTRWRPAVAVDEGTAKGAAAVDPVEREGQTPPAPARSREEETPPEVTLKVEHCQPDRELGVSSLGEIGRDSFETRYGEGVRITVQLARPAHCFLIACNCDGTPQLLWPCKETFPYKGDPTQVPAAVQGFQYPPPSRPKTGSRAVARLFTLEDDPRGGMQAFIVVASPKPLPSYEEWAAQRGGWPWTHWAARGGVVRSNGERVEQLKRDGVRGQVKEYEIRSPVLQLCSWARRSGLETVEALMFPVSAKE